MKLINPTYKELEQAFAKHVAGLDKDSSGNGPSFARSIDAVMPWLQQFHDSGRGFVVVRYQYSSVLKKAGWFVQLNELSRSWEHPPKVFDAICTELPVAIAVALLKAHGVEIEAP